MRVEICPLAADFGNWADWAAVVVGAAAAGGTIVVAALANRTAKRAAEIAEEATKIAGQQHGEAVKLREENARIIGRLLLYEIIALPARLSALLKTWEFAVDFEGSLRIKDGLQAMHALDEAEFPLLPGAEKVEDRIHQLPDSIGADLATLIGGSRTLAELVRKIRPRIISASAVTPFWRYSGDVVDFDDFRHQVRWLLEISEQFENDFRAFVGVPAGAESGPDMPKATS